MSLFFALVLIGLPLIAVFADFVTADELATRFSRKSARTQRHPCLTLSSGWAPRVASDDGIILAIIVNVHVRTTARSAVADRKSAVTQVRACEAG